MSIELQWTIAGVLIPIIFYLVDKYLNASTRAAKKYLIYKWLENKKINKKLQNTIYEFAMKYDGWNYKSFTDSNLTYKDFYNNLKEKYDLEYSDVAYSVLKKMKLTKYQIDEFIAKLKIQEDNLNLLQNSIDVIIKKYEQENTLK
ncbi:hypothetical protein [Flavobacterium rhizosphaerae]|uniref:Bacteriophage holin of superfamily 6 (Holin_LLH) n=1 Tax=Flavobacterium rhizosphaerae TaxID=3163298 RepID=A0ABW8YSM5_9FLAO